MALGKFQHKLRKENEQLKSELAMETRHASVKVSTAHASRLSTLTEQGNLYTSKIAVQERNLAEIEKQMALMREKVMSQRKRMGGVNAARENQMMVQKQIRILENRLDKALVKFNEALAHNKNLRETIDNLRRERVVFDNIYRKLEKELHEKKKKMELTKNSKYFLPMLIMRNIRYTTINLCKTQDFVN